jgi:hypothetical protein
MELTNSPRLALTMHSLAQLSLIAFQGTYISCPASEGFAAFGR